MPTPQQIKSIPFRYANAVRNGDIIVGKRIIQAVDRFYSWIATAQQDGYYLDHEAGMHVVLFFEKFLVHTKGVLAGKPFILSPYQQFTYYNIFAWKHQKNGLRRINTVYEKVARKNGKTAGLAGLGLYVESFDGDQSPEIYVGATKELQAKTCWNQGKQFIMKSPFLKEIGFKTLQRDIQFKPTLGTFQFLGGDSKTLDSLNPSLAIIDEYHAHKDDSILEVLESGMGARQNPLVYIITTAGVNIYSACKLAEDDYKLILDGLLVDDSMLIMIHDIDEGDDWEDENIWEKANPNIRYNPPMINHIRKQLKSAKNRASKIPNFQTKYLNMWVDAPEIWIPDEIWQKGAAPIKFENFIKYGAYAALDLSTTIDLTAFVILSEPDKEGIRDLLPFFFCPKDTIDKRSKEDRVPYRLWMDQGYLTATPGNVIDYDEITKTIEQNYAKRNIKNIEVDKWNATQLVAELQELNIEVSYFSQAIGNISYPTKQFEKLVYEGKIRHGNNPVLRWMLSGCVIYQDANENIKVHKGRSNMGKKRVDGIIATIMALGGSLTIEDKSKQSKYNDPNEEICFGIPQKPNKDAEN